MIFGMARHGKNQKEYLAAEMLLKGSGLNMLDAASLAVELLSLWRQPQHAPGQKGNFSGC